MNNKINKQNTILVFLIFFISILVYFNSLQNEFTFDDITIIKNNLLIRDIKNTPEIFTTGYWWGGLYKNDGLYRPLVILSYALNFSIHKLEPFGYHLINVLIHSLNSILIFLLIKKITNDISISVLSSIFFAIHPIHTECVSGIIGRAELLSTFFTLLSFLMYLKTKQYLFGKRYLFYSLSLIFFALGLLSKENAITLLLILIIYDFCFNNDFKLKHIFLGNNKMIYFYIGYVIIIVIYLLLKFALFDSILITQEISFIDNPLIDQPFAQSKLTALFLILKGILLLVFPLNISADYSYNQIGIINTFSDIRLYVTIFFVIIILLLLIYSYRKRERLLLFSLIFYFGTVIITANLFFFVGTIFAERLLYLPSIGYCFILAILLNKFFVFLINRERGKHLIFLMNIICIVIILFYSSRTIIRNFDWKNNLTIFLKTTKTSSNSAKIYMNLGIEYLSMNDLEKALYFESKALAIFPEYGDALNTIGAIYFQKGELDKAQSYFEEAIKLNQKFFAGHSNLGLILKQKGDFKKAIEEFEKSIQLNPHQYEAYYNISLCYIALGELSKAKDNLIKSLEYKPDNIDVYLQLALISANEKDISQAIYYNEKIIMFDSNFLLAYSNLARLYILNKDFQKAKEYVDAGLIIEPNNEELIKIQKLLSTIPVKIDN